MYTIASSSAAIASAAADLGTGIALVVGIVLAAWAALVALGFFTTKATKKVTGKKW